MEDPVNRKLGRLIFAAGLMALAGPNHAAVYKCVSTDGVTTYAERPCSESRNDVTTIDVEPRPRKGKPAIRCEASRPMTEQETEKVRAVLTERLYDSESARFASMVVCTSGERPEFCGKVNARNRMGAYVGFRTFVGVQNESSTEVVLIDDADSSVASMVCADRGLVSQ